MVERVKLWVHNGVEVRIFTARVCNGAGKPQRDIELVRTCIQDWTEKHIGKRLPVTHEKNYGMLELWDDRAIRVIANTGKTCC